LYNQIKKSEDKRGIMKKIGVLIGLCLGAVGQVHGTRYSLDPRIYNAVYMLNPMLVKAMLAEHSELTLEEKQHLLDLIRRRVDTCSQKMLTTAEKFDRVLFGFKLMGKGLLMWWGASLVSRWVTYWFRQGEQRGDSPESFTGNIVYLIRYFNPLKNNFEYEQKIARFIVGELTNEAGLMRLMYFLIALGGTFHLTGVYKIFSLVMHLGRDQDVRKAEEIEYIISSMPIRS
jgi:hypothetical protein